MGMKMTTKMADVTKLINRKLDELDDECISNFELVGEAAVAHVRSLPSLSRADFPNPKKIPPHQPYFIDLYGSLRSSVGYVIAKDGEIVKKGGFHVVKDGKDGAQDGEAYAESLASRYPHGIVLILVAGMIYAARVQNEYGYDVLTSAELLADKLVKEFEEKM